MNTSTRQVIDWLQIPALLISVAELSGCTTSAEDACDPSSVSCGTETVQLCNDANGNVYYLVSDGTRFECGNANAAIECVSPLFTYCHNLVVSTKSAPLSTEQFNKALGTDLIQERQRRLETEKLLESLTSGSDKH